MPMSSPAPARDIKPDAKYVAFEGKVFVGVEVERILPAENTLAR